MLIIFITKVFAIESLKEGTLLFHYSIGLLIVTWQKHYMCVCVWGSWKSSELIKESTC